MDKADKHKETVTNRRRCWREGKEEGRGELLTPASELDSKMRERSQQDKYSKQGELQRDTV